MLLHFFKEWFKRVRKQNKKKWSCFWFQVFYSQTWLKRTARDRPFLFVITGLISALKLPIWPGNSFVITECSLTTELVITEFQCMSQLVEWVLDTFSGNNAIKRFRLIQDKIAFIILKTRNYNNILIQTKRYVSK